MNGDDCNEAEQRELEKVTVQRAKDRKAGRLKDRVTFATYTHDHSQYTTSTQWS